VSHTLGILFFVVALLTSVMIHEGGHFLTARAFGMKATQFFVGFGPTLFSRQRGETEYGVKAIPAGGFVKITGMTPLEELDPADAPRAFWRGRTWQRVVVLTAGSVTHFVIAIMLMLGVAFFSPRLGEAPVVSAVSRCLATSATATDPVPAPGPGGICPAGSVAAPAQGVLQVGDRITAVQGKALGTWVAVFTAIRAQSQGSLDLTVQRGGHPVDLSLQPVILERPADSGPGTQRVAQVGIMPTDAYTNPTWSQAWHSAAGLLGTGDKTTGNTGLLSTFTGLRHIPSGVSHLFDTKPVVAGTAAANRPSSVVGIAQVSGDIFSGRGPLRYRLGQLVLIVALVNFFVGVINLLPFLPFDGGHVAVTLWQRLTRRRVRDRSPEAEGTRLSSLYARWAVPSYAIFAVVAVLSLLTLTADVTNPVKV